MKFKAFYKKYKPQAIVVLILLLSAGALAFMQSAGLKISPTQHESDNTPVTATLTTPTSTSPSPVPPKKTSTPTRTTKDIFAYQKAVTEYANRRLQFDSCVQVPATVTYKAGMQIMLDGRSADPQTIHIDTHTYALNGFDFKIITLDKVKATTVMRVSCESQGSPQYNIGKITIYP